MIREFFQMKDGAVANLYSLRLADGFGVDISNFGGCVISIFAPDKNGELLDVALGWKNPADYLENPGYLGALVGRVPNRIGGGRFVLDGVTYQSCLNDRNASTLHGGFGYSHRLWNVEKFTDTELVLSLVSPHGDAGFPGELKIQTTYRITSEHSLEIEFYAESDRPTVADFTNHTYFNLNGESSGVCDEHFMQLTAEHVTKVDENLIPTGEIIDVAGTRFDVRKGKKFREIYAEYEGGFDDNFILDTVNNVMHENVATVTGDKSGIRLAVDTDRPGLQIYMGYFLEGDGKNGKYGSRNGFCLETQGWPDSVNHSNFPSIRLDPGKPFKGFTRYKFSVVC
ncbi:MAG: galactose mutarotase [Lentisphaeria bacterium]|nr:galactose mutarotase [Lentisphaeria bacterium]